jgi:NAD(P) transhydrogenase subunit alpha
MEAVPRIARAQKMDALSSMASIAGYRAVLEPRRSSALHAAAHDGGQHGAARAGAGHRRRRGQAVVHRHGMTGRASQTFDVRPAVADQVKSLGGEFVSIEMPQFEAEDKGGYAKAASEEILKREQALFEELLPTVDIVICTALVPGREAPRLITEKAVRSMKPGSVIVDLAVEQGGNCALSKVGEAVRVDGTTILGWTNLPARMPADASRLYAKNVLNLLMHMHNKEGWAPDPTEEVTKAVMALRQDRRGDGGLRRTSHGICAGLLRRLAGCLETTPALHTPLMSVTNAISGIIVVGAMIQVGPDLSTPETIIAAVAIFLSSINVAGGFLVTQRMLRMFRKR